ncbi:uncharacterized protein [Primulina eburnea]|uniref:uncharacterized protein isoform X2 n=1 Tax=Primulina eburnea TaxID=1245227 RepID=UPI003C6C326F
MKYKQCSCLCLNKVHLSCIMHPPLHSYTGGKKAAEMGEVLFKKTTGEAAKPAEGGSKGGAPKTEEISEDKMKPEEPEAAEQPQLPLPPQEIILKVYMHCEGCARKVSRCLQDFEGVEDVITDCRTSKVVVKGEKADPLKILERVQKKSHRQVKLISPIPKPPAEGHKKPEEKIEVAKSEEKKEEEPPVVTVVLGVYMHCEACAQEIKKRIERMKGVKSAEPDLKCSQVTVKGVFEPETLADYVWKRTGKHAVISKVEPETKPEEKQKEGDNVKKAEEVEKETKKVEKDRESEEKNSLVFEPEGGDQDEDSKMDFKRNEIFHNYPQNYQVYPDHQRYIEDSYATYPPPQIFSDENPNACFVM